LTAAYIQEEENKINDISIINNDADLIFLITGLAPNIFIT
jgi:hypothetical protein